MAYTQGFYKPKHPQKYKGDPTQIVYRSSWELKLFMYLDKHQDIIWWKSEELAIPYRSPVDGRIHRYYPDVIACVLNNGKQQTLMIEVKPESQTREPKRQPRPNKRYLKEVMTWGVNSAKWESAKQYCELKDWKFVILTEHDLGIK